jgi:uncharacterized membrane protein YhhN
MAKAKPQFRNATIENTPKGVEKSWAFEILYALIVIADIIAIYYKPGATMIIKPLIVASLLGWYINGVQEKQKPILLLALLFALLGDIMLLFEGPTFFQAGIGAFLIMQVLYTIFFNSYGGFRFQNKTELIKSAAVVVVALVFNVLFFNKLGAYKVPVIVYSIAICAMVIAGLNQKLSTFIVYGAVFFLISDFALAYHKFVDTTLSFFPAIVMTTYALAQYFIVRGLRNHS